MCLRFGVRVLGRTHNLLANISLVLIGAGSRLNARHRI